MHGSQERYGQPLCCAHSPDPEAPAAGIVPWQLHAPYFTAEECAALEELPDIGPIVPPWA